MPRYLLPFSYKIRRSFTSYLLWLLLGLLPLPLLADKKQPTKKTDTLAAPSSWHQETDLVDILDRILFPRQSVSLRKQGTSNFAVMPAIGYSMQTGFAAAVSANVVFNLRKSVSKTSSIISSITYSQYNQIIVPFQADIWSGNNKYKFVSDFRYMKYPSITYGLGIHSSRSNGYLLDFNYLKFHQTIYRGITKNFFAGIGYFYDYFWNISEPGAAAGQVTDFQRYGYSKRSVTSGPALRALYDSRINPVNPNNGQYFNLVLRPNFKALGSDDNFTALQAEYRTYVRLPGRSSNVLAFWSYNWFSFGPGQPPYLLLPSTGWDDFFNTGRGYIQGRYRGKDMIYLESEYRFKILNNGLLGGVVFANGETFSRRIPMHPHEMALGAGAGLRIKINKFSGTNLAIDYGFGSEGSRGLAINLGEVF